MKRTINLVGQNTLTVSLPSEFVKKQGLKKGQEVDVEEQGNALLIRTEKRPEPEVKKIVLDEVKPITKRYLDALYKKGYDEIEIHYKDKEDLIPIKEALDNEMKTFEIVEKSQNLWKIRSVSELDDHEFDNLLRQTMILMKEMIKEMRQAIEEKNQKQLRETVEFEKINNKLTHLLRRSLNRKGHPDYKNTILIYIVIEQLEKAADEIRDFCRVYMLNNKEVAELIKDLDRFTELFYELFYHFDNKKVSEFANKRKDFLRKLESVTKKENPQEFYHLRSYCEILFNLTGPIVSMSV